ncbi:MAG: response regulator [Candidatus Hydrogenedentota bacterium]
MSKPSVLIVDDEPDIVALIERTLKSEGFDVYTAYDGISALDIAAVDKPQVIVLDIMMPMMSGYETCIQLKADPETRSIPVICLTSAHSQDVREKAQKAGAQALLIKPIMPQELVAQIKRYLPGGERHSD